MDDKDELTTYRAKRDFSRTPEPRGDGAGEEASPLYVIQKHDASHLHFDLRLELDGVLKSWAIPKGPSLDPSDKRLAIHVEDHPLDYGGFEGTIPQGEYGGGTVMLWDRGTWEPRGKDPRRDYRRGRLSFRLHGERLRGEWTLSRMGGKASEGEKSWLLIKKGDQHARNRADLDITAEATTSVGTGRSMEEIAAGARPRDPKREEDNAPSPFASFDFGRLDGARKAKMPKQMSPQLAKAVQDAPKGERWLHEIKYDGYRILCFVEKGKVRMLSRNGKDWTGRFPEIAELAAALPVERAVIDGEVTVIDEQGATDFQALQNVLRDQKPGRMVFFVFDLPYLEGWDLTGVPLRERKALLERFIPPASAGGGVRYSDHIPGSGEAVFRNACRLALEGIVSKRADSLYLCRRSDSWRKVKCLNRQEFVIGGYTEPGRSGQGIGALLLGLYGERESFEYAGRVGTGFSTALRRELAEMLTAREISAPPFASVPRGERGKGVHWVRPELVAEIEFTSWTRDGRLRHPSFKGLREDKEAKEIRREPSRPEPGEPEERAARSSPPPKGGRTAKPGTLQVAGVHLSNPDRVLYPRQGLTKEALARYYERIAPLLMPHIVRRPLTLVRCPRGHQKNCFFQRHYNETLPPQVRAVSIEEKGKKAPYLLIDDLQGLISLVQLGVLEIHPWGSREDRLERPDRVVFDLDPGPDVPWEQVIAGAREIGRLLEEVGLESFVKTTGGKGLHVVVPLLRRSGWDEVKAFARAVALRMTRRDPQRYVATMSKARRPGRIFIDYLRNSRGATSVAPFVTRALPGAPVSTPLAWDELATLSSASSYTVENLPRRLAHLDRDPWEGFFDLRQSLTKATRAALEF